MFFETSSKKHGNGTVFVSSEKIYIVQISNITFFYNRCSISTNDSLKSGGGVRIQLLLQEGTWSTRYNIPKNDPSRDTPIDWTLVNFNFTVENYVTKLFYDQIDTTHADMCFSNITITHSIY